VEFDGALCLYGLSEDATEEVVLWHLAGFGAVTHFERSDGTVSRGASGATYGSSAVVRFANHSAAVRAMGAGCLQGADAPPPSPLQHFSPNHPHMHPHPHHMPLADPHHCPTRSPSRIPPPSPRCGWAADV
jgi:hypothetical protein